jgi:phage-related protein
MKPLVWFGSTLDDVRRFSTKARQLVGYQLYKVQTGLEPSDWKPMAGVGPGVREIRVHAEKEHRVIYIARFEEAVYVLHAFIKKTARTPKSDLDLAARRFREVQISRRGER